VINTLDQRMNPDQVGWKFSRLQKLHEAGILVPKFFCIPGNFFRDATSSISGEIDEVVRDTDMEDWSSVRSTSAKVRQIVLRNGLGTREKAELRAALHESFADDSLLAVRASVIATAPGEGEDSADNPFAGMSESFLYVTKSDVENAVLECWASAFSAEGLLYRYRQGLALDGLSVAVGVQRMIFGERSLVLFTCDPTTYSNNTVVSAAWGIGEGVVQEKAPADHYFVHARTGAVESFVAEKTNMITFDAERGRGTRDVAVSSDKVTTRVLAEGELRSLARLGKAIEELFGEPQDIEATITADDQVHVVQSRPITIQQDRYLVWSSANVSESFPNTTTPMTYSVAKRFYRLLNHDYLRRLGVKEAELRDLQDTLTRLLGFLDGRIYHNITSFVAVLSAHPILDSFRKDWERLVAELDTSYHHKQIGPRKIRDRAHRRAKLIGGCLRVARDYQMLPKRFAEFQRCWRELLDSKRGPDRVNDHPLKLVSDYRQVWRQAGNMWGITLVNYQYMILFHRIIEQLLKRWGVEDGDTLFSQLLCGGRQLKGAEIALSAVGLAELVRENEQLREMFASRDPGSIWKEHTSGRLPEDFSAAVDAHLKRYGDRGIEELKLEKPNLRDTPWELVRLVQQYAGSDLTVASMEEIERATRLDGERLLRQKLPGKPWRRAAILALSNRLRDSLYYREAGRYMRSELFGYSKQVIRRIGSDLCRRGVLSTPDDVFFLDLDELFGFVDGSGSTYDLSGVVEVRKQDFTRAQSLTPEREFTSADVVSTAIPHHDDSIAKDRDGSEVLRGLGSCPGKVRGRARVVSDPSLGGDLGPDSILIARETDPGWLYLMLAAKGIAVERGSLLSHTAITGRKFGIPTIVGVPEVTKRIPDGSLIEVDGASGDIVVLESAKGDK
jgi:phosphohistidine swiveling domain-containing protein